jgi:hypothetical protein
VLYKYCKIYKYCKNTRIDESFGLFAASEAATHGRVDVLEWLDKKDMIDNVVINEIIAVGTYPNKTEVLKFARKFVEENEIDLEFVGDTWDAVLNYGIHDFIDVRFDRMYGYEMDDMDGDCDYLAGLAKLDTEGAEVSFGHAECLRFLRSKGLPWNPDEATRARAAAIGIA